MWVGVQHSPCPQGAPIPADKADTCINSLPTEQIMTSVLEKTARILE